jgi:REP element-mobilizing transposase RayT
MLYKNKYRVESARLKNWDYSSDGRYFITICTVDHVRFFGTIANGIMLLSEMGKIADQFWREIPNHFPMVRLDAFVIMPNHVHGIIIIDNKILPQNPGVSGISGILDC